MLRRAIAARHRFEQPLPHQLPAHYIVDAAQTRVRRGQQDNRSAAVDADLALHLRFVDLTFD